MKNKPTKNVPKKFFIKIVLFYLGGQSVVGRNKLFNLIKKILLPCAWYNSKNDFLYFILSVSHKFTMAKIQISSFNSKKTLY